MAYFFGPPCIYRRSRQVDWISRCSRTSICRWHASARFQYADVSRPAADAYVGFYWRSSKLDVIGPSLAQCTKDMLWCASSGQQKSSTHLNIRSFSVDYVTLSTAVRDRGIYIDSDVSMRSEVSRTASHCFGIPRQLHTTPSVKKQDTLLMSITSRKLIEFQDSFTVRLGTKFSTK